MNALLFHNTIVYTFDNNQKINPFIELKQHISEYKIPQYLTDKLLNQQTTVLYELFSKNEPLIIKNSLQKTLIQNIQLHKKNNYRKRFKKPLTYTITALGSIYLNRLKKFPLASLINEQLMQKTIILLHQKTNRKTRNRYEKLLKKIKKCEDSFLCFWAYEPQLIEINNLFHNILCDHKSLTLDTTLGVTYLTSSAILLSPLIIMPSYFLFIIGMIAMNNITYGITSIGSICFGCYCYSQGKNLISLTNNYCHTLRYLYQKIKFLYLCDHLFTQLENNNWLTLSLPSYESGIHNIEIIRNHEKFQWIKNNNLLINNHHETSTLINQLPLIFTWIDTINTHKELLIPIIKTIGELDTLITLSYEI